MVDLEEHCFPPATILSEGGATWERVSPFPVTLVPSSCLSSATVEVCVLEVYGSDPLPYLKGGSYCLWGLHFERLCV